MRIYVLGGKASKDLSAIISERGGFECFYNSDLSTGLSELEVLTDVHKIVMFDGCLIKNNNMLDLKSVFNAVARFASDECEVLMVTKQQKIRDEFTTSLYATVNCRCVFVEGVTGSSLVEIIMNKTKPAVIKDVVTQQPNTAIEIADIASVQSEVRVATLPEVKVESGVVTATPKPEPAPEPVKEIVPEPIPQPEPVQKKVDEKPKKKSLLSRQKSLGELLTSKKVICVTGPQNSGVTSTACELLNVASKEGIKAVLVDLDLGLFGANMYYDCLDNCGSSNLQKYGLVGAVRQPHLFEECTYVIDQNISLLGCSSDMPIGDDMYEEFTDDSILELVDYLSSKYQLVIIHTPYNYVTEFTSLVRVSDTVLYCTPCTINGCSRLMHEMYISSPTDSRAKRLLLLHRKLSYVLCNIDLHTSSVVTPATFNSHLKAMCDNSEMLIKPIAGTIERYKGFDDFKDTKQLYSNSKSFYNNYRSILENLIR